MATSNEYQTSPLMVLKRQHQLYDLHTHLLGIGNSRFWVDTVLMNPFIMPKNETFLIEENTRLREELCPLVWANQEKGGFVDGRTAAAAFNDLVKNDVPPTEKDSSTDKKINEFSSSFSHLTTDELYQEMKHRDLSFRDDFSYDVVLKLTDLGKSLGINQETNRDLIELDIAEKLGFYSESSSVNFRDWIIFSAREQKFEIIYGLQVGQLRDLITIDQNAPNEVKKQARNYIINAFTMCKPDGTQTHHVDLHTFYGKFAPRILSPPISTLIGYIIEHSTTCLPLVRYCEFSVSANDLCRPWVFDVLRSVRVYDETNTQNIQKDAQQNVYTPSDAYSSFSQIVLSGHFPHLEFAFKGAMSPDRENNSVDLLKFTYKFLAAPLPTNIKSAIHFLYVTPAQAIILMINEIIKSKNERNSSASDAAQATINPFSPCLKQLEKLKKVSESTKYFFQWIVGFDLFGDELGYPYCPFVARPFINFIKNEREKEGGNKNFGVRIHCGENVIFADDNNSAYRLFIAHIYIVFRCLRFLQQELKYGIRIGHGIAFDRILGQNISQSRHRKSSVLLAEMREHANFLFKTIAFEVNLTSNEYLLGQTIRQGTHAQSHCFDALIDIDAPIILATDDDGIWPIDQCLAGHPGHQSLTAEYCRAISSSTIKSVKQLKSIFQATQNFCFWDMNGQMPKLSDNDSLPDDDSLIHTVIIHHDVIRRLRAQYNNKFSVRNPLLENYKIHSNSSHDIKWKNEYGILRVVFICIHANHNPTYERQEENIKSNIKEQYCQLFNENNNQSEFEFIYENWRRIRSEFIFPDSITNDIRHGYNVILEDQESSPEETVETHLVYSSLSCSNQLQSPNNDLLAYLHNVRRTQVKIHAFTPNIDHQDTVKQLRNRVRHSIGTKQYHKMSLIIYTNTDKYAYTYSEIDNQFELQINPNPSKRKQDDETFLYVLCDHAQAATAAL
ncbi:hypothetical protein I4U23_004731 [Adineta vaga]|nr:hypothetical protein I4U23_004731 [Adineta vaga]